jgi:DNA mismatch repair protein MSH5
MHLLGILNNTKTSLGRSLLRTWLFRPSLSIPVITARHDAIASFLRPENLITANTMHSHLKGIKNVPRILGTMRNGKAGIGEWQGLVKVRN